MITIFKLRLFRCSVAGFVLMLCALFTGVPAPAALKITGEAGLDWVSFHYEEPDPDGSIAYAMKEDGSMPAVFAGISCEFTEFEKVKPQLRALMSFAYSDVEYNGWLMDTETRHAVMPVKLSSPNAVFQLRMLLGLKNTIDTAGMTVTPVTGVGFRYLFNDLPGKWGYSREQTYWYLPVGIDWATRISSALELGLRAEYDYFLRGYNVSGGDSFDQSEGYGYLVSVFTTRAVGIGHGLLLSVEPYYRYWNIGQSTMTDSGYVEPANSTVEYGLRCSLSY